MKASSNRYSSLPGVETLKGRWQQYVGATAASSELTEDELLKLEGHTNKLAGLIHERYAVTHDEAALQVKRLFA